MDVEERLLYSARSDIETNKSSLLCRQREDLLLPPVVSAKFRKHAELLCPMNEISIEKSKRMSNLYDLIRK